MAKAWPNLIELQWNLVSSNVKTLKIERLKSEFKYWIATVPTGVTAPGADVKLKSYILFQDSDREIIDSRDFIDIYIWLENADISANITAEKAIITDDTYGKNSFAKLIDSNNLPFGILQEDGCVSIRSYMQAIAEGDVTNHLSWSKIGSSPASTTAESLLWNPGIDYIWPAVAQQMEIVSSSANDIDVTGSGARTILISYLTADFTEKSETIALNGTTPVPTVATDIYRINSMIVLTAGTGLKAAGNISLRNLADTPIYEQIAMGGTAAKTIIYTVPKNKVLFITSLTFSAGANATGKRVTFTTRGTYDPIRKTLPTTRIFYPYTETSIVDSAPVVTLDSPSRFPTGTDLKISVQGESGVVCTAMARGWIESV